MEDKELNESFQKCLSRVQARKAIEDTPEVMELRRLRDEAQKAAYDYQKQIDAKIMETHETPDLVGKYIKTTCGDASAKEHYGLVKEVHRLFDGIKIVFEKAFDYDEIRLGQVMTMANGALCYDITIGWDHFDTIEIISEEEYNRILIQTVTNVNQQITA